MIPNHNILKVISLKKQPEIRKMLKEGHSISSIARHFKETGVDITYQSIRKWVRKHYDKRKGSYKDENKKNCRDKAFINQTLTRMTCKLMDIQNKGRDECDIVLLDGTEFGTTNYLTKRGIREENIDIPNNTHAEEMIEENYTNVHNMSFGDFMNTTTKKYDVLYPDYCGNWIGRARDIDTIFKRKTHKDIFLLAISISPRNPRTNNNKTKYSGQEFDMINTGINKLAGQNNLISKLMFRYSYTGMIFMVFGISTIEKHTLLNQLFPEPYKTMTFKLKENGGEK